MGRDSDEQTCTNNQHNDNWWWLTNAREQRADELSSICFMYVTYGQQAIVRARESSEAWTIHFTVVTSPMLGINSSVLLTFYVNRSTCFFSYNSNTSNVDIDSHFTWNRRRHAIRMCKFAQTIQGYCPNGKRKFHFAEASCANGLWLRVSHVSPTLVHIRWRRMDGERCVIIQLCRELCDVCACVMESIGIRLFHSRNKIMIVTSRLMWGFVDVLGTRAPAMLLNKSIVAWKKRILVYGPNTLLRSTENCIFAAVRHELEHGTEEEKK